MKIKVGTPYPYYYDSLGDYARSALDGGANERGQLEAMSKTIDNNSKSIGRLLDHLAAKGLVTPTQVTVIVEGYARNAEFCVWERVE